jgi:hypothetical protein
MSRHRRTDGEQHHGRGQRRREMKALRRSVNELGQAWAGLGISMGTNALRGVVNGMRATAEAISGQPARQPDSDSPTSKPEHAGLLQNWTNVASTWAEVGLAMGKAALEKSAEGLEMTATALENKATPAKHQESTQEIATDKPSDPQQS